MDDATLRRRLWEGFARLQALLGGHAVAGEVLQQDGLVASIVPRQPDSPALNAAVAVDPRRAPEHLEALAERYAAAGVRRWGIWLDGSAVDATQILRDAGMIVASASPGMGAEIAALDVDGAQPAEQTDLATVGKVNDLAYGNADARLERTLESLPPEALKAFKADHHGLAAAAALALYHGQDCGLSFVATVPDARRQGLATEVMLGVLADAREHGCTTVTLQATPEGERLYEALGLRRLGSMELWEHRR